MGLVTLFGQLYTNDGYVADPTCEGCAFRSERSTCNECQGTPYRHIANAKSAIERHGNAEQPKVYLSGAITGTPREKYLAKFANAERKFRSAGYAVLNPAIVCDELPELMHHEYMNIALEMLKAAQYIYVIDGEDTSEGVKLELEYSKSIDIRRIK